MLLHQDVDFAMTAVLFDLLFTVIFRQQPLSINAGDFMFSGIAKRNMFIKLYSLLDLYCSHLRLLLVLGSLHLWFCIS